MLRTTWTQVTLLAFVSGLAGPAMADGADPLVAEPAAEMQVDDRLRAPARPRERRWLLPDIADDYERRPAPMIRWRVNKVKLRVPFG